MAGRNSPHDVYYTPISGSLEQQYTWPLVIIRIVFNYLGGFHTLDKFPCKQAISGDLIVSMLRNPDISLKNQCSDVIECITHNTPYRCLYYHCMDMIYRGLFYEGAPCRFGKKATELNLYFRQGIERIQVNLLTARGTAV